MSLAGVAAFLDPRAAARWANTDRAKKYWAEHTRPYSRRYTDRSSRASALITFFGAQGDVLPFPRPTVRRPESSRRRYILILALD